MSSRGTANVLTRATAILAGLFFVTSLVLSILAGVGRKPRSILEGGQSAPTAPGAPPPLGGRRRRARPAARRLAAGAPAAPVGAAGAAVEVKSQPRGREIRPLRLLEQE